MKRKVFSPVGIVFDMEYSRNNLAAEYIKMADGVILGTTVAVFFSCNSLFGFSVVDIKRAQDDRVRLGL
jgi:hypothetical protein